MKIVRVLGIWVVLMLSAQAQENGDPGPSTCGRLATLRLAQATVTSASQVAPGAFTAPGGTRGMTSLPAFCRVAVTATPTTDSDIRIEVWLPSSGWNGKFQAVGNGGWAGTIAYGPMGAALTRGYAAASTDTGHTTPGASFSVGHPEKLIDYAHRSLHEMAVHAKTVVDAYYGRSATAAIWNGCSTGGNQGLTLASMYPADFDAIIAGASPDPRALLHGVRLLLHRTVHRSAGSYIPPEKYPAIHQAVLDACDAGDGVKDGVLENPRSCRFDPKVLECKSADGPSCLTREQVETARAIYSEVKHPRTGRVLYSPLLVPGSELNWGSLAGPQPFANAAEAFKYLVAKDPAWDPSRFNGDADLALLDTMGAVLNTASPNLKPFFAGGGKLLMYHGWNDQQVPSMSSVSYFTRVVDAVGGSEVGKSIQLYMVPGMNHCQGGVGTDTFDKVGAMEQWMAQGRAPDQIVASHATDGKIDRTRPLCPYPQVAVYKGSGSTDDASNFSCRNGR